MLALSHIRHDSKNDYSGYKYNKDKWNSLMKELQEKFYEYGVEEKT